MLVDCNEKFSYQTCHLIYLELDFSFQIMFTVIPFSLCTVWQSLRFQTNHAPSVYSAPYLLPFHQAMRRVLHYMMGFESQLCYGAANQEISLEKSPHMGWLLLFYKAKRNKRGTGVRLYRAS